MSYNQAHIDASVFGGDLELENRSLRARIADMDAQIQTLQSSRLIAPHEEEAIAEKSRAFDAANNEQNRVVKFLRDNFAAQMARGDFTGMSFSQMVIHHLKRARLPWWRRLFL